MTAAAIPVLAALLALPAAAQRLEIQLERLDGASWHTVDPGLVLRQGDRVRFRFRANFDGFLYVMNRSSSGNYEQLFPREETGADNRVAANQDYRVPSTSTAFRIAGPPGYETVYWLVTPARLTGPPPRIPPPAHPLKLDPRCDDTLLKARGDCIDTSAGPKLIPRGDDVPEGFSAAPRDLIFMRQDTTAVIAAPERLTGPLIYEFRIAHR